MNKQYEALQSVMAYFNKDEVTVPQELYEQVFNSLLDESLPSTGEDVQRMADYEEIMSDHRRLVKELDVLLNGENAAEQASLCDIVAQVRGMKFTHAHPPASVGVEGSVNGLPEFSQYLINEINGYQHTRDGWKEGSQNFEAYDLVVRVLRIIADKYLKIYATSTPPAKDNWIKIEEGLPEKPEDGNESEKWKLCCTEFGAVLLSLCYYDHNTNKWYDAHNPSPEERVAYWKQPTPPTT